jgi:hypothetical protein
MSKIIAVVGPTSTGKSTSIQGLNPQETYIISVAGKELPFKGSNKIYNSENKNYAVLEGANEITDKIAKIAKNALQIKTIVIDDSNYIMAFNLVNKATETGYTKFSIMAKDMTKLIQEAKKHRDDLTIAYITHSEEIEDGNEISGYKIKTAGKMIDNQIVMEGLFTTVLYSYVETKGENSSYYFLTNRYLKFPAKSPVGMFNGIKIPNDLKIVVDAVNEYYK